MDGEQRRKVVAHQLVDMGLSLTSWSARNGLHYKIVTDLIDGKLRGTRGVALETRRKIELTFGDIFSDVAP
jgi:hypothetical protein